ncbi:STAS domain-containing protein [Micromonospora sp. WMMA1363]|uniref:STAS domain-containing protein n=1 Tax=Micromonospora sp. WMMA1363 TaxID=3053985 RepID=UPI00259D2650|nr:STAS domain-containing protein [Micromonospora sp. WMMA1363]MDM4719269.1 STAS domain-containing protein [Micromonospora sp. WMMA1363]
MTAPQAVPPECTVPRVEVGITEDLHLDTLPEVGAVFDRILSLDPHEVVVDLSGCRHIDAAAISLLLDVHRRLTRRRAVLVLRDPNPRIRSILHTARVDAALPIVSSSPDGATAPPRPAGAPSRTLSTVHGRARVAVPPRAAS